jgi:hypothetical protein
MAQTAIITAIGGSVQYLDAGVWKRAFSGVRLSAAHQLKLIGASYAALVVNGSKSIELRKPGIYKISELAAGNKAGDDIAAQYMNFIIKQMVVAKDNRSTAAVERTGAVERGSLKTLSPIDSKIADDALTFIWFSGGVPNAKYLFELLDEKDNILYSKQTSDTIMSLDLSSLSLVPAATYRWRITLTGVSIQLSSDEPTIQLLSAQERKELAENADRIAELTGGEGSAMSQAVLATLYQSVGVNYRAMRAYLEAIRLAPEADTYKILFNNFLLKLGLPSIPALR